MSAHWTTAHWPTDAGLAALLGGAVGSLATLAAARERVLYRTVRDFRLADRGALGHTD
ncbi:hypothetical protein [Streptomyces humi]|uniref:hypothetical protein n=1 Tax=Streptomyces humi TaxID=1428620 RepID=UPI00142E2F2A|nr:hypothetical protein [Streptomyces humi]